MLAAYAEKSGGHGEVQTGVGPTTPIVVDNENETESDETETETDSDETESDDDDDDDDERVVGSVRKRPPAGKKAGPAKKRLKTAHTPKKPTARTPKKTTARIPKKRRPRVYLKPKLHHAMPFVGADRARVINAMRNILRDTTMPQKEWQELVKVLWPAPSPDDTLVVANSLSTKLCMEIIFSILQPQSQQTPTHDAVIKLFVASDSPFLQKVAAKAFAVVYDGRIAKDLRAACNIDRATDSVRQHRGKVFYFGPSCTLKRRPLRVNIRAPVIDAVMLLSKTLAVVINGTKHTIRLVECSVAAEASGGFELHLKHTDDLEAAGSSRTSYFPTRLSVSADDIRAADMRAVVIQYLTAIFDGTVGLAKKAVGAAGTPLPANSELVYHNSVAKVITEFLNRKRADWQPQVKITEKKLTVMRKAQKAQQSLDTRPPLADALSTAWMGYYKTPLDVLALRIKELKAIRKKELEKRFANHLVGPKKRKSLRPDGSMDIARLVLEYAADPSPSLAYTSATFERIRDHASPDDDTTSARLQTAGTADTELKSKALQLVLGMCQVGWDRR
jgi:hypothetical protein